MFTFLLQYRMGWLAPLMISLFAQSAMAAPGSLDTTFGSGGKVIENYTDDINKQTFLVATQADGKIVVAGTYSTRTTLISDFVVLRYNSNGMLDTTFSDDGKAYVDFGGNNDQVNAVTVQTDGRIVVVGTSTAGVTSSVALARFTQTGELDTTFDGDGKLTTTVGEGSSSGNSIALQSDNKILVAGTSKIAGHQEVTVLRYTSTGALDTTFDTDGIVTVNASTNYPLYIGPRNRSAGKVLVNPRNQSIILVGKPVSVTDFGGSRTLLDIIRLTPTGSLDNTFGLAGQVLTYFEAGEQFGADAGLQTDGKLVVAGSSERGGYYDFALARYNINGSLDTTFSTDGNPRPPSGSGSYIGKAMAIQADGKILIGGSTVRVFYPGQFNLARYTITGELDPTFGAAGRSTLYVGQGYDTIDAMAIQTDGKIVAVGNFYFGPGTFGTCVARISVKQVDVRLGTSTFAGVGNNLYTTTAMDQELTAPVVRSGGVRTRYALIQNDGPVSESFFVWGTAGNRDFRVQYFNGASDITTSVVAGTYRTGALGSQRTKLLTVKITANTATAGRSLNVIITAWPVTDSTVVDRANLLVRSTR